MLKNMTASIDMSAYCEEGGMFTVYVDVAGDQRFGPSFCMLNNFFCPIVLICLAVLGGTRIMELMNIPGTKPYTHFDSMYDTAQFGLLAAGILLGLASGATSTERAEVGPRPPPFCTYSL